MDEHAGSAEGTGVTKPPATFGKHAAAPGPVEEQPIVTPQVASNGKTPLLTLETLQQAARGATARYKDVDLAGELTGVAVRLKYATTRERDRLEESLLVRGKKGRPDRTDTKDFRVKACFDRAVDAEGKKLFNVEQHGDWFRALSVEATAPWYEAALECLGMSKDDVDELVDPNSDD